MRQIGVIFLCICSLIYSARAFGGSWSMSLWDPSHSSFNAGEFLINRENVWSLTPNLSFHADGGFIASPTVINGIAYIGDTAGYFYAFHASERRPLWRQFVGMAPRPANPICKPAIGVAGQAVVAGGVVYVPGGDSAVYALDQRTGSQLWRVAVADPGSGSYLWSSLVLLNHSLYLGLASLGDCPMVRGAVVRIDIENPDKPVFFYMDPDGQEGGGVWSTPAVDVKTNTVYITSGNGLFDPASGSWGGTLLALDGSTFSQKSYFQVPGKSPDPGLDWSSSPTLFESSDGTPLIAAAAKDGALHCLKRDDLSPVWTTRIAMPCDCPECGCGSTSTPAFDGRKLYLGAGKIEQDSDGNGSIYSIDPSSGSVLWSRSLAGTVIAPVTLANGVVFASTLRGLMAFDAGTGETLWDDGGRGPLYSQPVVVDGVVYSTYVSGELVVWGLDGANLTPILPRPSVRR